MMTCAHIYEMRNAESYAGDLFTANEQTNFMEEFSYIYMLYEDGSTSERAKYITIGDGDDNDDQRLNCVCLSHSRFPYNVARVAHTHTQSERDAGQKHKERLMTFFAWQRIFLFGNSSAVNALLDCRSVLLPLLSSSVADACNFSPIRRNKNHFIVYDFVVTNCALCGSLRALLRCINRTGKRCASAGIQILNRDKLRTQKKQILNS